MEFEDSREALFAEPNAYIQKFDTHCDNNKKIVFQEPYDRLPTFYLDNDFKKGNCDCIPKPKPKGEKPCNNNPFPFDLKSLMPLISGLSGGSNGLSNILSNLGSGGLNNIASLLGGLINNSTNQTNQNSQNQNNANGDGFNLSNIMSVLNGDGTGLNGLLDLFKNFGNKNSANKIKTMKSSDVIIKNYKRVE